MRVTANFINILLLIVLGYALKRFGLLKAQDSHVLSALVLNVTLPALVIVNLNKAHIDVSLTLLPVLMIVYGVIAKGIVIWLFIKYSNQVRGAVGMMMASLNIGIFAYPLVAQIWPDKGLLYFGMVDIGGALIMYGVTYFVAGYFSQGTNQFNVRYLCRSIVTSVPLMTYMIMLVLNVLDFRLPHNVVRFFDMLGQANLPLSMILLGLLLNFSIERRLLPLTIKYLVVHYGIGILAGLAVYFFLPVTDDMIKTTLILTWLLPVGVSVIPFAVKFRYQMMPFIVMTTNITIIISIIILYAYQALFMH